MLRLASSKVDLIQLRKVSTHVSLRSPRRLTWVDTFRYLSFHWHIKVQFSILTGSAVCQKGSCGSIISLLCITHYGDAFNPFPNKPWFLRVCSTSFFENTVGKGEIAHNEQFLLFPQCFLPAWRTLCHFH